jgi:hypothetical protein
MYAAGQEASSTVRNQNELDSGFPEFGSYREEGAGHTTRRKTDHRDGYITKITITVENNSAVMIYNFINTLVVFT